MPFEKVLPVEQELKITIILFRAVDNVAFYDALSMVLKLLLRDTKGKEIFNKRVL